MLLRRFFIFEQVRDPKAPESFCVECVGTFNAASLTYSIVHANGTIVQHVPETEVFPLENCHGAATLSEGGDIGRTVALYYPPESMFQKFEKMKCSNCVTIIDCNYRYCDFF